MKIGDRVTPTNPTHHQKHGYGCLVHFHGDKSIVHFENGTRGLFSLKELSRQLTVSEAARRAAKDMVKEEIASVGS